ncbi:hypothetical protein, partial [Acinetobacter baumannii]|uniref:hypothetical protein n=1 Tax=Acinetobacter baumannii TaxID=470 RepID=UPI0010FCE94C
IQRLIVFGINDEFKEILAILIRQNPDRISVLCNLSCTELLFIFSLFSYLKVIHKVIVYFY